MPEMLFPDNRFKSPTSYSLYDAEANPHLSGFGLTYACDSVRSSMAELEPLLAQAKAARLLTTHLFGADEGHPIAVNAQAVYRQAINDNLVIFTDEACDEWTSKLQTAVNELRNLLEYNQTSDPAYVPPVESPYREPETPDTLDKLKPLFIAGAVIAGVVLLMPIVFEVAGVSKALRTKKRYAGSRR